MMSRLLAGAALGATVLVGTVGFQVHAERGGLGEGRIQHVLLISIDGMHSVDFTNCIAGSFCPRLAELGEIGANFTLAQTSRPSDSFPGLTALVTGGSPRSTGAFYDVSYDRSLSPPAKTTPYGIQGGQNLCPSVVGTQIGFDEEIDVDLTRLDAGGGIDPGFLPRDPKNNCAPVFPHTFIRVNTIFEVVKAAGGYTAWSDKHQSYELTNGQSGKGVDDYFAPEINSFPVPLPQVSGCNPLPDPAHSGSGFAWTDSFANIRCYDTLKVQAILNEIDGKDHTGMLSRPVPNVFGMNFQAVSVGQKLVETINGTTMTGGYLDNVGTPSPRRSRRRYWRCSGSIPAASKPFRTRARRRSPASGSTRTTSTDRP
jgi:Type I phosphodiesterase / nucleotide pyrophosphatase